MKRNKKGFTLMEMLIVVAIIAVLVAIAIPVFNAQLHKTRVATDWANVRAYYAEIQTDYISTGEYNPNVPVDWHTNPSYDWKNITFLNGQKVELVTGTCAVSFDAEKGYSVTYQCDKYHEDCYLTLSN